MSRLRRVLCACAAGLTLATIVGVGRVSAHAELVTSDPQPGQVLDAAPAHVRLTFSEPVEISLGAIRVFDGNGDSIDIGTARHPEGSGEVVEIDVPDLANGSYVVDWRVVSSDSHPVHAAFTFQVGPDSTLSAGLLDQIIGSSHTGKTASTGLTISRSLVTAAIAIVFGGLVVCGSGIVAFGRRQRTIIAIAAGVGAVAGLLAMPLEVGYTAGRSLDVITDGAAWRAVLDTTIGVAWLVRAATIAVVAAVLLVARSRSREGWWNAVLMAGLVTVGIASAYGGHGASGRWHYIGVFVTMLHVSAMAVWLGGLVLLLVSLDDVDRAGAQRFSGIALLAVASIVITGTIQGFRQVGSIDGLTDTSYGKLLIWKVVAVMAIIGIAAVARASTHGRLALTSGAIASPASPASVGAAAGDSFDRARLRRAITIESVLAVVVIVVTSLLMAANPSQATASAPFSTTLTTEGYLATIDVAPARVGANEMHIYLSSPNSSLTQADAVTVTIQDPSRDVDPIEIPVSKAGAGHVINNSASFPYAATWRLVVTARYGFDEYTFTADVKVV